MKVLFFIAVGIAVVVNLVAFFGEKAMKKKIRKIAEEKQEK